MTPFRCFFLLFTLGWAILIYTLSSQPGLSIPVLFTGQDKLFHAIVFGVLGFCLLGTLKPTSAGYSDHDVMMTVLLVMLYGVSDEFHQIHVPGRSADILDVLADTAGGMLGTSALQIMTRLWPQKQ